VDFDLGRFAVQAADEVLEVEDDVRDVLTNALERRELVRDPLDLDRGDGSALERREQHATQRVAEGVTEAAVERLDLEDPALLVQLLVDDLRDLKLHQTCASSQCDSFLTSSRARR
jgi:plasmid stability protein